MAQPKRIFSMNFVRYLGKEFIKASVLCAVMGILIYTAYLSVNF
jgi:hypothetical protein